MHAVDNSRRVSATDSRKDKGMATDFTPAATSQRLKEHIVSPDQRNGRSVTYGSRSGPAQDAPTSAFSLQTNQQINVPEANETDNLLQMKQENFMLNSSASVPLNNEQKSCIRALADLLVCRHTSLPLSVGMFSPVGSGLGQSYLHKAIMDIKRLCCVDETGPLEATPLLFLFPPLFSAIMGYLVGLIITWQAGLTIGLLSLTAFTFGIAVCLYGSRRPTTWPISNRLAQRVSHWVKFFRIVLNMLFCHPPERNSSQLSVKYLYAQHTLSRSNTAESALLTSVERMWTSVYESHSPFLTQILRIFSCRDHLRYRHKYKRICCFPLVLLLVYVLFAILIMATLLRVYEDELSTIFKEKGLLTFFSLLASSILLIFFICLPSLCRAVFHLIYNCPLVRLRQRIRLTTYSNLPSTRPDSIIKPPVMTTYSQGDNEFTENKTTNQSPDAMYSNNSTSAADPLAHKFMNGLINHLNMYDGYSGDYETRILLCIDASELHDVGWLTNFLTSINRMLNTISIQLSSTPYSQKASLILKKTPNQQDYESAGLFNTTGGANIVILVAADWEQIVDTRGGVSSVNKACAIRDAHKWLHSIFHLPLFMHQGDSWGQRMIALKQQLKSRKSFTSGNRTSSVEEHNERIEEIIQSDAIDQKSKGFHSKLKSQQTRRQEAVGTSNVNQTTGRTTVRSPHSTLTSPNPSTYFPQAFSGWHQPTAWEEELGTEQDDGRSPLTKVGNSNDSRSVIELFVSPDNELSDLNVRIKKNLITSTAFTVRLLRLQRIDFPLDLLVRWICLCHHWPCHVSWLLVFIEDNWTQRFSRSCSTSLQQLFECLWKFLSSEYFYNYEKDANMKKTSSSVQSVCVKQIKELSEALRILGQCDQELERLHLILKKEESSINLTTTSTSSMKKRNRMETTTTSVASPPLRVNNSTTTPQQQQQPQQQTHLTLHWLKLFTQMSLFFTPFLAKTIRDIVSAKAFLSSKNGKDRLNLSRNLFIPITSFSADETEGSQSITDKDRRAKSLPRQNVASFPFLNDMTASTSSKRMPRGLQSYHDDYALTTERQRASSNEHRSSQINLMKTSSATSMVSTRSRLKCPIIFKEGRQPTKELTSFTVEEVRDLLETIVGFSSSPEKLADYQQRLQDLNITGLVLSVCDLEQLRPELSMTFGDWQLFRTLILYLREVETLQQMEEITQPDLTLAFSPTDRTTIPADHEITFDIDRIILDTDNDDDVWLKHEEQTPLSPEREPTDAINSSVVQTTEIMGSNGDLTWVAMPNERRRLSRQKYIDGEELRNMAMSPTCGNPITVSTELNTTEEYLPLKETSLDADEDAQQQLLLKEGVKSKKMSGIKSNRISRSATNLTSESVGGFLSQNLTGEILHQQDNQQEKHKKRKKHSSKHHRHHHHRHHHNNRGASGGGGGGGGTFANSSQETAPDCCSHGSMNTHHHCVPAVLVRLDSLPSKWMTSSRHRTITNQSESGGRSRSRERDRIDIGEEGISIDEDEDGNCTCEYWKDLEHLVLVTRSHHMHTTSMHESRKRSSKSEPHSRTSSRHAIPTSSKHAELQENERIQQHTYFGEFDA